MRLRTGTKINADDPLDIVFEYHQRTKHQLDKYATGPEFLDWDLQPYPYRVFSGTEQFPLSLDLNDVTASYQSLYDQTQNLPLDVNLTNIGKFLGLGMGLSAHKEYMGDRWSLRCNPSSGNLHPTEAYLISSNIDGMPNGVYHYLSKDHSLQQRFVAEQPFHQPLALVALTSIHWREAWKYGERAFRYCQLDIGHALASLAYAAATLGWRINVLKDFTANDIATLCGLNGETAYNNVEPEYPDLILEIVANNTSSPTLDPQSLHQWIDNGVWQGLANRLDKHPLYQWPVIDQVEHATRGKDSGNNNEILQELPPLIPDNNEMLAKHIIYGRRSAQHFDKQTSLSRDNFYSLLDKLLIRKSVLPWNALSDVFPMLMVLYVHRVNNLSPGLYLLANTDSNIEQIKTLFDPEFIWQKASGSPDHIPFYLLSNKNVEKFSKTVSCHQNIACDGVFSASMLLKFDDVIREQTNNYRKIHWQAGLTGQILYLEAESFGLRGTGIGCFFDDVIHTTLGLKDKTFQVVYNFTCGAAFTDSRITTLPAYEHLDINL